MGMTDKLASLEQSLAATRRAARDLARCHDAVIREVLNGLADRALAAIDDVLAANRKDLSRMPKEDPKYDRLLLDEKRLRAICDDLRCVAQLPSPVGEVLEQRTLPNGLELSKVRVPMGVIAVIFESRPNVTFDVFALCLKTRNACVLKGSSDARDSNEAIVRLMQEELRARGVNPDVVFLAPAERRWLPGILQAVGTIDLAIPRQCADPGDRDRRRHRSHLCRRERRPRKGPRNHHQCQNPKGQCLQRPRHSRHPQEPADSSARLDAGHGCVARRRGLCRRGSVCGPRRPLCRPAEACAGGAFRPGIPFA